MDKGPVSAALLLACGLASCCAAAQPAAKLPACSKTGPRTPANPWCVALTFDDGPSGKTTPQVLSILRHANVHATFFLVGSRVPAQAWVLQAMAGDGNEIGDHSWDHAWLTRLSSARVAQEVQAPLQAIEHALPGTPVRWFRAPYGAVDGKVESIVKESGLGLAWWTADDSGWKRPGTAARVAAVLDEAEPGGVILMHDTEAGTVTALPQIIADLKARGAVFVTLSQMAAIDGPVARIYFPHRGWPVLQPPDTARAKATVAASTIPPPSSATSAPAGK